jgi:hypothetical protein
MTVPQRKRDRNPVSRPVAGAQRWLLFVHQLPSSPSNLRVRTWRRLQQIGALPIKQALYVLPDSPNAREDFEWLKTEIEAAGGQARVFAADAVDSWSNDALIEEFRRSRQESYDGLAREAEHLLKRVSRQSKAGSPRRAIQQLKERLAAVEQVDFFGSAGRDRVITLVQRIEERATEGRRGAAAIVTTGTPRSYTSRTWVTRPRPGVDRMASAWLIRRFIDAEATFGFVADREAAPWDAIPFDMFGVELTHRGDLCTFEMLCETFHRQDAALTAIGAIVHDLDLKDGRFGAPEAPAVGLIIEGLLLAHADDHDLLTSGIALFEALYRALAQASRVTGPRAVARRRRGVPPDGAARQAHRRPPRRS